RHLIEAHHPRNRMFLQMRLHLSIIFSITSVIGPRLDRQKYQFELRRAFAFPGLGVDANLMASRRDRTGNAYKIALQSAERKVFKQAERNDHDASLRAALIGAYASGSNRSVAAMTSAAGI